MKDVEKLFEALKELETPDLKVKFDIYLWYFIGSRKGVYASTFLTKAAEQILKQHKKEIVEMAKQIIKDKIKEIREYIENNFKEI